MPSHVLILGCGRSGTSIFGELFQQLTGYQYFSEPPFDDVVAHDFRHPTAIKVPTESAAYPAPPGLSFPLHVMRSVMPQPRAWFWQVRHPLDAIASLRVGISQNWGHHPRPLDWQDWIHRPLVEQCAHHWAYLNTVGFRQVRSLVRVCRFENMIRDPQRFALEICRALRISDDRIEPQVKAWCERLQDSNNEKFVEAITSRSYSRPDHSRRIGRWKENLSEDDVRRVAPIVREAACEFGYELPGM